MKRVRVALGLLAALLVSSCATPGEPTDLVPVTAVQAPQPVGAVVGATAGDTGGTANCGDPTASLRPGSLPSPGQMPSGSTMDKIAERGRLVAGVDQNTYLFGFRNPATGNLEGFDIDLVGQIAKAIFGDASKVQYKVITSNEREDALRNGDVDIVVRTFTINCARLQNINFSAVYYVAAQRLLVDRNSKATGLGDLAGQRVCANAGSTSLARIAKDPAKPVPVSVVNWSDCLVMLQQGQVAAVSTDDTILGGMLAQDPNLKIVGPRLSDEPYGVGIPKANTDMVRFVNGVLEKARNDGTWQASYNRWLGQTGQSAQPPQPKYRD